jgi:pSer/pThr/pTyr-binding forkhead associated (FHA) protein
MRALKKKLKDRYPTAKEMGRALGYREEAQPRTEPQQPRRARLLILQGPRQGHEIHVTEELLTVGRFDLDSSNTTVSRRHANILFRGDSYWLQDTSKNGTWVDNQRVYGETPLRTGAIIAIGDSVLRLEQVP